MKLLTIIGARPQIIKAAAFSRAVKAWNEKVLLVGQQPSANGHLPLVEEVILHTGQHYDDNMSAVFFRELGIPEPDINLHAGSGTHGVQTAKMIEGIEEVLTGQMAIANSHAPSSIANSHAPSSIANSHAPSSIAISHAPSAIANNHGPFDGIVLYGDTNSTLAGAVAASKIHIPVFHIEAGLRSFNMAMPEEINRIVCDNLSSILFSPTETGVQNLLAAGFTMQPEKVHFADGHGQYVVKSGDVMYDNSMYFAAMAEQKSDIIERLGLQSKQFVLATIHRPANTDSAENLSSIFRALLDIAENNDVKVVLPLHPRTRKLLPEKLSTELLARVESCKNMLLIDPASFFEIIRLERHARIVMTDSGGVQKEAFFFGTPCVILRPETEWVEIVNAGAGILADADYDRIMSAYRELSDKKVQFPPLFGDAHAAEHILEEIVKYCSSEENV